MNKLKEADLKNGYIFLNIFDGPDKTDYEGWSDGEIYTYEATKLIANLIGRHKDALKECHNLIHFLISRFDNSNYTHAALFFENDPSTKGEYSPCVCEAGPDGVYSRNFRHNASWRTDVVELLALKTLPVDPIASNAGETIDKNVGYGYETAMLMMAICVLRRWKQLKKQDEDFLRFLFGEIGWNISPGSFSTLSVVLRTILEALVVRAWNDNRLMCSQFVSLMFNMCDDARYNIAFTKRPMWRAHQTSSHAIRQASAELLKQLTEFENSLKDRAQELPEVKQSALEDALKSAFTPGDIRASKSIGYLGQLSDNLG